MKHIKPGVTLLKDIIPPLGAAPPKAPTPHRPGRPRGKDSPLDFDTAFLVPMSRQMRVNILALASAQLGDGQAKTKSGQAWVREAIAQKLERERT